MPKDRSWVLLDDHRLDAFQNGCVEFLDFAFKKAAIDDKIRCPCRDCKCGKIGDREFVHKHLLWRGWHKSYGQGQWIMHLESSEDYNRGDNPISEEMNKNKTNDVGFPEVSDNPRMAISADHGITSVNNWTYKHLKRVGKNTTVSTATSEESVASTGDCVATKKRLRVENSKPCQTSENRGRVYDKYLRDGGSESTANSIVCQKMLGTNHSGTKKVARSRKSLSDWEDKYRSLEEHLKRMDEKIEKLERTIELLIECLQQHGIIIPDSILLAHKSKKDGKETVN